MLLTRWYFTEKIDCCQWNIYILVTFLEEKKIYKDDPFQVLYSKRKTSVINVCYKIHICRTIMSLWLPYHECCFIMALEPVCRREGNYEFIGIIKNNTVQGSCVATDTPVLSLGSAVRVCLSLCTNYIHSDRALLQGMSLSTCFW